ncbi:MAG: AraC family transcriptional regulator [Sphingobacterium sp.]|jgi:AraC-like DNA-binding protein|uniref:AraC family transcriptional regulator n=1 Tax=Sphingobacterium sp. TaxID=341027 RepID=UPI00283BF479|nr:helix-turn-helix transcriptional regulator [Sphingobacterium sp.]MDR3010984.1 AraC family transcriptional regulator [Sphingobacterium sp.]
MRKKDKNIPVNRLPEGTSKGIMMMRESFHGSPDSEVERAHRDGGYTFIIQEKGNTTIEIDFQTYCIKAPAIVYINPHQVHRVISFDKAMLSTWIVTEENIRAAYLSLLQDLTPAKILSVKPETLDILTDAVALCMKLSGKKTEILYHSILKESCNTLITLIISQYLVLEKSTVYHTRFEDITRAFKTTLEKNYKKIKNPRDYAGLLNLSTSYLNECVKVTTGKPVSIHIQQRIVLEAKRLLYHSGKSVKEIADELGYDDFSYFTRLFSKTVGMSPTAFLAKNRE